MLIILEGPDGAGKSTLAEELADEINSRVSRARRGRDNRAKIIHKGPPTSTSLLDEYMLPLNDHSVLVDHVVCDRWHLGEMVYPALLSRESLANDTVAWFYLEKFLQSRGALVVHVDASYDTLIRRLHERGDEVQDYEFEVARQRSHFEQAVRRTWLPTISGDASVEDILERAWSLDVQYTGISRFLTYVGPRRPEYLLLGDVRGTGRNMRRERREALGAFTPYGNGSGRFLLEALQSKAYTELEKVGITNINEPDVDLYGTSQLLMSLGKPTHVATLGVNATKQVQRCGITSGSAPHPQFIKRFHHYHQDEYGQVIWRALQHGEELHSWRP